MKKSFVDQLGQQPQIAQKHSMTTCRRTGIKIRDHNNAYKEDPFAEANAALFNKQKAANRSQMPPPPSGGSSSTFGQSAYADLDLNLNHYDRGELLKLFGFPASKTSFDAEDLKDARKIMLKTHPDKSGLAMEYFVFFQKAYERLRSLAEFSNQAPQQPPVRPPEPPSQQDPQFKKLMEQANQQAIDSYKRQRAVVVEDARNEEEEARILDKFFESFGKQALSESLPPPAPPAAKKEVSKKKDPNVKVVTIDATPENKPNSKTDSKAFNEWFNAAWEKHKLEDEPAASGYGDWLKSEEDIAYIPHVNKSNMMEKMEQHKRNIQAMVKYQGVEQTCTGNSRGNELMQYDSNFSSGGLFGGDNLMYTDLKQAYVESVIPVTEQDFLKVQQYRNVDEYKRAREEAFVLPSKEDALQQLYEMNRREEEQSAALAFYLAKQNEEARQKQNEFWASMKHLTNK